MAEKGGREEFRVQMQNQEAGSLLRHSCSRRPHDLLYSKDTGPYFDSQAARNRGGTHLPRFPQEQILRSSEDV